MTVQNAHAICRLTQGLETGHPLTHRQIIQNAQASRRKGLGERMATLQSAHAALVTQREQRPRTHL